MTDLTVRTRGAILIIFLLLPISCSRSPHERGEKIEDEITTVKIVTLTTPDRNYDATIARINEKLAEDLHCRISVIPVLHSEEKQKYPLILMSRDNIDLIWGGAYWNNLSYLATGAFLEIGDMLKTEVPDLYEFFPPDCWKAVTIGSGLFCVPVSYGEDRISTAGFLYREDLRKKMGVPEILSLREMELYLSALKREYHTPPIRDSEQRLSFHKFFVDTAGILDNFGNSQYRFGMGIRLDKPEEIINIWETEEFRLFSLLMEKWANMGFWERDILFTKTSPRANLLSGRSFCNLNMTPEMAYGTVIQPSLALHSGWEWKYLNYSAVSGYAVRETPLGKYLACPVSAENPELALKVLEKFTLDREYYSLVHEGIGEETRADYLGYFPINNAFRIDREFNINFGEWEEKGVTVTDDIMMQFPGLGRDLALEQERLTSLYEQYALPLLAGIPEGDFSENIHTLQKVYREAGQREIFERLRDQWSSYFRAQEKKNSPVNNVN